MRALTAHVTRHASSRTAEILICGGKDHTLTIVGSWDEYLDLHEMRGFHVGVLSALTEVAEYLLSGPLPQRLSISMGVAVSTLQYLRGV